MVKAAREAREETEAQSAKLFKKFVPTRPTSLDEVTFELGCKVDLRKPADRPAPVQPWVPVQTDRRVPKATCRHGHQLVDSSGRDSENVVRIRGGGRRCKACQQARNTVQDGRPRTAKATTCKNGHSLVTESGQLPDHVRLASNGRRMCMIRWRQRTKLA